jgi:hypothetical protein
METPPANDSCSSQALATTLLDAWLSGDRYRLSWELDRIAALPQLPGDGAERDRMEILTSIVSEMQAQADLFVPRSVNARIGAWMALLDHFSGRRNVKPN